MNELEVRIITLEPVYVAAAHGYGPGPEGIAWEKITAYIQQNRLLEDGQTHRFFGFNNPDPSPGSPNYGYEQWVTVSPDAQPGDEVELKQFSGGLYAVTRASLAEIGETWQKLVAWRERSAYHYGGHQWLEEMLTYDPDKTVDDMGIENVILDLYMPIAR